jgi:hypothetical protein
MNETKNFAAHQCRKMAFNLLAVLKDAGSGKSVNKEFSLSSRIYAKRYKKVCAQPVWQRFRAGDDYRKRNKTARIA